MKNRYVIIFLCLLLGHTVYAQIDSDKDLEYEHWQKIEAKYKLNKKIEINGGIEMRWETNPGDLRQLYGEIEPSYELSKWMDVELGYRFISDLDQHRNRFYFQLSPTYDISKRWEIDARIRYEINERRTDYEPRMRIKLNPEYSRKKHKVGASAEIYLIDFEEQEKWRYAVMYRYSLNKRQDIGLRLIYDIEETEEMAALAVKFSHEF